jgi:tripartite-type tricarboxylate transporter receptor subunit TctC
VPTFNESGVKGFEIKGWFCMLAPAGTPAEIVNILNRALVEIVALPEVKEKLVAIGADPETGSPDDLQKLIASEIIKYKKIIEIAGAKLE